MDKEYKYHYFYKITNKISGKYYYGIHSTNDLNDKYMGSGTLIKEAIKEEGISNFEKEIIKFFVSREEASEYENSIVTLEEVMNPNCYNIKIGGDFGETIGTILVIDKRTGVWRRCLETDENYINGIYMGHMTGKTVVQDKNGNHLIVSIEEYKSNPDKYESVSKGKIPVKDKLGNILYVSVNDERYKNGELECLWKGLKHSEETKEKMRMSHQKNEDQKGDKNSQYNTHWVTKDGIDKKVKDDELEIYISSGWKKGRFFDRKNEHHALDERVNRDDVINYRREGKTWTEIQKIIGTSKTEFHRYRKRNDLMEV